MFAVSIDLDAYDLWRATNSDFKGEWSRIDPEYLNIFPEKTNKHRIPSAVTRNLQSTDGTMRPGAATVTVFKENNFKVTLYVEIIRKFHEYFPLFAAKIFWNFVFRFCQQKMSFGRSNENPSRSILVV